jgi:hypothetical protein
MKSSSLVVTICFVHTFGPKNLVVIQLSPNKQADSMLIKELWQLWNQQAANLAPDSNSWSPCHNETPCHSSSCSHHSFNILRHDRFFKSFKKQGWEKWWLFMQWRLRTVRRLYKKVGFMLQYMMACGGANYDGDRWSEGIRRWLRV